MKGSVVNYQSLHIYNFGHDKILPFPSVSLSVDKKLRLDLKTSGMNSPNRWSVVMVGAKYIPRFDEILEAVRKGFIEFISLSNKISPPLRKVGVGCGLNSEQNPLLSELHEETSMLPFEIFLMTDDKVTANTSSHMTPPQVTL